MALQVWLPLNGNLNNQGIDNVTVTNSGTTVDNNGKIGKCYSFSANSAKITNTLSSPIASSVGTMSCWVKFNSFPANGAWYCLMQLGAAGGFANCRLGVYMQYQNYIVVCINGSSDSNVYLHSLTINQWYHLCATFDGTTIRLYIDGTEVWNKTAVVGSYTTDTSTLFVGGTNNYYFKGYMNDVRYYDTALSPKEIEILSRGLVCHYPLSGGGRGGDNLLIYSNVTEANFTALKNRGSGTWNKLSLTTKDGYDCYLYDKSLSSTAFSTGAWYSLMKANTTYTYSAWIYFTASANFNFTSLGHFQVYNNNSTASDKSHEDIVDARIYEPSTIPANKWTKIRITFTTNNLANSYFQVYPRYNIGANVGDLYFRDCKLEEGDHVTPWQPNSADSAYTAMGYNSTTEYDVSGYGYNGTKNGTITYLTDTPRYNVSTKIGTTASYIQIPNLTTTGFSNSYSFAWWGKVPTYTGKMMWGFSDGMRLNGIFNGNLWNTGDGANNPLYIPGTTTQVTVPTVNVWHHWVMTGDGTTCKVYQDGVLWATAKTYKSISGTTIYMNGWDTSTGYSYDNYQMSDFRIYATALSAEQVAELYNTAVSVANNGTLMGYELVEV